MIQLTARQIRRLKQLGHQLHPVIQIGKLSLTEQVQKGIDKALDDHELIKIKINNNSEVDIQELNQLITDQLGARIIRSIGHTILLYRPSSDENKHKISLI